jgi:hypothetical protein
MMRRFLSHDAVNSHRPSWPRGHAEFGYKPIQAIVDGSRDDLPKSTNNATPPATAATTSSTAHRDPSLRMVESSIVSK